ncbi:hypothetical protein K449DRAFT_195102 [Hypoxylon sp. EC38]|nr:hypothetical protein K449DRAFT_195102 [Hypoxylon sp. EC38]
MRTLQHSTPCRMSGCIGLYSCGSLAWKCGQVVTSVILVTLTYMTSGMSALVIEISREIRFQQTPANVIVCMVTNPTNVDTVYVNLQIQHLTGGLKDLRV